MRSCLCLCVGVCMFRGICYVSDRELCYCFWVLGCSRACNQSAFLYNFQYVCFLASYNSAPTQSHIPKCTHTHAHIWGNTHEKTFCILFQAKWFKPAPHSTSGHHVFPMLPWQSFFHEIFMFYFRVKGTESLISVYHVIKYKSHWGETLKREGRMKGGECGHGTGGGGV